jgi:hypothetical protein
MGIEPVRNSIRYLGVFLILLVSLNACRIDSDDGRRNLNAAYLSKLGNSDSVKIKVFTKAGYMVHDPISALFPKYYIDSMIFIVPDIVQKNIPFQDVQTIPRGGYPFIKGGIKFNKDSVMINLWYNDYDHKIVYAVVWNSEYLVKWE